MSVTRSHQGYAFVSSWVDGDTFKGYLEKAPDEYEGREGKPVRFRIPIINAPELKGTTKEAGLASLRWAAFEFPIGLEYPCWHFGREEYGRTMVDLIHPSGRQFSEMSLGDRMSVPYVK